MCGSEDSQIRRCLRISVRPGVPPRADLGAREQTEMSEGTDEAAVKPEGPAEVESAQSRWLISTLSEQDVSE